MKNYDESDLAFLDKAKQKIYNDKSINSVVTKDENEGVGRPLFSVYQVVHSTWLIK